MHGAGGKGHRQRYLNPRQIRDQRVPQHRGSLNHAWSISRVCIRLLAGEEKALTEGRPDGLFKPCLVLHSSNHHHKSCPHDRVREQKLTLWLFHRGPVRWA